MKNKYFYAIFKLKIKPWIKYWLIKKDEFKEKLSEILSGFTFNLQNTLRQKFVKFEIQGHSEQESTSISDGDEYDSPSPEHKQSIKSAGDNGSITEKIVNKNWYSSELELGSISTTTGENEVQNNACRSKDYIPVLPNKIFTISNDNNYQNVIYYYDKDKKFISVVSQTNPYTFTTPDNCYYMRNRTSAGNVQNDLTTKYQLELGSTATDYVPHEEQTYTIPTQQPFRSIGDVRDDFVKQDGVWYERHKIIEFIKNNTTNIKRQASGRFYFNDNVYNGCVLPTDNSTKAQMLCNILKADSFNNTWSVKIDGTIAVSVDNTANPRFNIFACDTLEDLETYLSTKPLKFYAILIEPTLLPCTQSQIDILENLPITYEGQTNIYSTDEVQAYLKIQYWEEE